MDIKQQARDHLIQHGTDMVNSKVTAAMTYGGSATAFIGGMTLNEFAIAFGMVIGLLGFILQIYQTMHKRKVHIAEQKLRNAEAMLIEERAQREREEHAAKMGMYQ